MGEDCPDCNGTGISPTGRVEDYCSRCHGDGVILESMEQDDFEEHDFSDAEMDGYADAAAERYFG